MAAVAVKHQRPWPLVAVGVFFDWLAVFILVAVSVGLSAFLVDPSQIETADKGELAWRAVIVAGGVTAFYGSLTWIRRPNSSVPDDVQQRLPQDPPTEGMTQ